MEKLKIMLPKGSKLVDKKLGVYVKLENENWSWWAKKDNSKDIDKRIQVRLTDEMAINGYLTYKLFN